VLGSVVHFLLALAGLGIMVSTRGAGIIKPSDDGPPSTGIPYR
jgi:hypothetical protein